MFDGAQVFVQLVNQRYPWGKARASYAAFAVCNNNEDQDNEDQDALISEAITTREEVLFEQSLH